MQINIHRFENYNEELVTNWIKLYRKVKDMKQFLKQYFLDPQQIS